MSYSFFTKNRGSIRVALALLLCSLSISVTWAQNCTVNAGSSANYCNAPSFPLNGRTGGNAPSNPRWTQVGGSSTLTITNPNSLNTTVTNLVPGVYTFRLTVTCGDGKDNFNDVRITVFADPRDALAGPDQVVCSPTNIQLAANSVGSSEKGTWKVESGNGGSFSNVNAPNAIFKAPGKGVYTLRWTITNNGGCATFDEVVITVVGGDQPVDAGPDQTLNCSGSGTTLTGSDPGLSPASGLWTQMSGPSTAIISAPLDRTTNVLGLQVGTYVFKWAVNGPCFSGEDQVQIVVQNLLTSPIAGSDKTQTFCALDGISNAVLTAAPLSANESGAWVQIDGPTANIVTPDNPNTLVNGLDGTSNYRFRWEVSNTDGCSSSSLHRVFFAPEVTSLSQPPNQELACEFDSAFVNITYNYGGITDGTGLGRRGTLLSSPLSDNSNVKIARSGPVGSDLWTLSGLDSAGIYAFQFEYRNACGQSFRSVGVLVSDTTAIPNAGANVILPCNEFQTQLVAAVIPPGQGRGTWSQVSGPAPAIIATPNQGITDVELPADGLYRFRYNITNGTTCGDRFSEALYVRSSADPVQANAGKDTTVCASPYILQANAPGLGQLGTWSGALPFGVSISNINNPNALLSGLVAGVVVNLTWTISNGCSNTVDQVVITVNNELAANADAGPDICLPTGTTSVQLFGSEPSPGVPFWSSLDGAPLNSTVNRNPIATLPGDGRYRFVYNILSPGCNTKRDTTVVYASGPPTQADAGPQINVCDVPSAFPRDTVLAANEPIIGTGLWRQVGGNAGPVIDNPNQYNSPIRNLLPGIYLFEWAISVGPCDTTFDTLRIVVAPAPEPVNAGTGNIICNFTSNTSITLGASPVVNGTGIWSVVSSPGGSSPPEFSSRTDPSAQVSKLQNGEYIFQWNTVSLSPGCPVFSDTVIYNIRSKANAGSNTNSTCELNTIVLTGNANTNGNWSQESGPNTATLANDVPTPNAATATDLIIGSYVFRYTISADGLCPETSDDITVIINPSPTVAIAPADTALCPNVTTVTLIGNVPSVGTAQWEYVFGPNTPSETNVSPSELALSGLVPGLYNYRYVITSGSCPPSSDNVFVLVANAANAGADQAICATTNAAGNTALLSGNISIFYPGLWTKVSGPAATITNDQDPNTSVTGLVPGTYVFKWTIQTPTRCGDNFDEVTIRIDPVLSINGQAGPDKSKCENDPNITLGLGTGPNDATYTWTPSTFLSSATGPTTTFTGNGAGLYTYTLRAERGACQATDQVQVRVNSIPVQPVLNGPTNICENTTTTVSVRIVQSGVTYNWVDASSNSLGSGNSKVVGPGTYTVTPVSNTGSCPGPSATITIIGDPLPTTAAAGADVRVCQNITTANLTGNTPTVGLPRWQRISGPNTPTLTPANGEAVSVALSNLVAGSYTYRYSITSGTCPPSTDDALVLKERLADAGTNQRLCAATQTTLTATTPNAYPGVWSIESKPAGAADPVFADPNNPTTLVTGLDYVSASGTYLFRFTINSGGVCPSNVDDVQVIIDSPITIDAGPTVTKCETDLSPVIVGPPAKPGIAYNWAPSELVSSPNSTPVVFLSNTAGRYTLTLTASNNSCIVSDQTVINILPKPQSPTLTNPPGACAGGTALVSVINPDPDATYFWRLTPVNVLVAEGTSANLPAGSYTVQPVSNSGCFGVPTAITLASLPLPQASFTQDPGCSVEYLANDAGPNTTYKWAFTPDGVPRNAQGKGVHSILYREIGTKTAILEVTDALGCQSVTTQNIFYTCTILPVTLLSFDANWSGVHPEITWELDRTEDMKYVAVQRSTNGSTFTDAVTIPAVDRQSGRQSFRHVDQQVPAGVVQVFYRLQMSNKDGSVQYSPIRQVSKAPTWSVTANPTPFTDRVLLTIESPTQEQATISMVSVDGRVLLEQKQALLRGVNTVELRNLGYLPAGNYWIRVESKGQQQAVRTMKTGN